MLEITSTAESGTVIDVSSQCHSQADRTGFMGKIHGSVGNEGRARLLRSIFVDQDSQFRNQHCHFALISEQTGPHLEDRRMAR